MYNASVFRILLPCAEVAKSVDAVDSKSTAFGHAGSIPAFGTISTQSGHPRVAFFMSIIFH